MPRKATSRRATKRVASKPSKRKATKANQPTPLTLFKVVKRGTDDKPKSKALVSIFTRGVLRLTYNKKTFTKAPAPQLPITGFDSRRNAERFIARNRSRMQHDWILVQGVGVPADDNKVPAERLKRPCDLKNKTVKSLVASFQRKLRGGRTSRRGEQVTSRWTRGTVFVQNFKITEVLAEYAPA